MITRRDFIVTSAATASTPMVKSAHAREKDSLPLRALPKVRTLSAKPVSDGRLLLTSDGPEVPPELIRQEPLERAFGRGITLVLTQPDHWRMIKDGWFSGEDLYQPTDFDDPAFQIWQANYRPVTEAHDLLCDLFRDKITGPFGTHIPDLGLELAEHPNTPRYATAKLDSEYCLPRLATELAARTSWLVIDPQFSRSEVPS